MNETLVPPALSGRSPRPWARTQRVVVSAATVSIFIAAGTTGALAQPSTTTSPTASASTTAPTSSSTTTSSSSGNVQCSVLHTVIDQGTTESNEQTDPKSDSGTLSAAVIPVFQEFGNDKAKFDRTYVPYPADFGFQGTPYAQSAQTGVENTFAVIEKISSDCPETQFAIIGYSQGAQVASTVLRLIGAGQGPIPSSKVAMGMLLSDPSRQEGSALFPGRSASQVTPDPAPGTSGAEVKTVAAAPQSIPAGAGIAPPLDNAPSTFGQLTGRVASKCATGDLACDTPADAPLARLVANVGGQLNLNGSDPVGVLSSVANVFGTTAIKTAADVVNKDLTSTDGTLAGLDYRPSTSLSERAATASDPGYETDVLAAVSKVVGLGVNTAVTLARKVVTPENIAQIAAVGLANPAAGLALFGAKLGQATFEMLPANIADRTATTAVKFIKDNISDNAGLIKMATDTKYWQVQANHGSYMSDAVTNAGGSTIDYAAQWLTALVKDLTRTDSSASTADAGAFTRTVPVSGQGSYQGLPGLNMPVSGTETGAVYDPFNTSQKTPPATTQYTSTPGTASSTTSAQPTSGVVWPSSTQTTSSTFVWPSSTAAATPTN
ncbi:cutinase family protein [Rhodococcus qingshengii]|uniref:cutinase family protein n=1 Tax=Rhodococcus qingshengii TaxID=334542 RepID=UPI002AFDE159|nr:cutinase family protein [Rhodococcus qingshengii]MEA1798709.1 cutinase family protein [Rhodococcus qingshengii]